MLSMYIFNDPWMFISNVANERPWQIKVYTPKFVNFGGFL